MNFFTWFSVSIPGVWFPPSFKAWEFIWSRKQTLPSSWAVREAGDRSEKRHCIHENNVTCPGNAFPPSPLCFCVEEHSPYLSEHLDLAPEHRGPFLWSSRLESQKHHLAQSLQGQESHLCPWVLGPRALRGLLFGSYNKEQDTNVAFRHNWGSFMINSFLNCFT